MTTVVSVPAFLPIGSSARGPRPTPPKPSKRKKRRLTVRESRRRNR